MNLYPYDTERPIQREIDSLLAWINWQTITLHPDDIVRNLTVGTVDWVGCTNAIQIAQVTALLHWWTHDLVAHVVECHDDTRATSTAYSLIHAVRQCRQYSRMDRDYPDYTELMEDQVTLMDPTMPDETDDWEEVA